MGLDSSGGSDGERGMALAHALGQRGSKSVTAAPSESPMMAWSTVCDDYSTVADNPRVSELQRLGRLREVFFPIGARLV
jgi:hypothetical protein